MYAIYLPPFLKFACCCAFIITSSGIVPPRYKGRFGIKWHIPDFGNVIQNISDYLFSCITQSKLQKRIDSEIHSQPVIGSSGIILCRCCLLIGGIDSRVSCDEVRKTA